MRYAGFARVLFRPSGWRRRIVFWWLARDGSGAASVVWAALPFLALSSIVAFAYTQRSPHEPRLQEAARQRAAELHCLAENIYFEARGEPLNGQYAVAEVTMNRRNSPNFPKTLCGVVYETRWDPLRRRFVAQFSWTQMEHDDPWGPRWQQANRVATAVLDDTYIPLVPDALYYHADNVHPYWADTKRRATTIGNHIFYY